MPADLQEKFLTEVSLVMWPEGAASPELAQLLADELGHRYLSKHHLLQPTLDGQLQFEHHVWRDWFMARALLGRMEGQGWAPRVLASLMGTALPEYCVSFLAMHTSQERLEAALRDSSLSDSSFSNLVRVAIEKISHEDNPVARAAQLAKHVGSKDAFKYRTLEKVTFSRFDLKDWSFQGASFREVVFAFCTLPRALERAPNSARGISVVDSEWWPPQHVPAKEILLEAKAKLRRVLKRFIWSTEPLRVRNEVSKEQMTREFHISENDEALRCLIKFQYIRCVLQAASKEYYILETTKLNELIGFMKEGRDLEDVASCMVK